MKAIDRLDARERSLISAMEAELVLMRRSARWRDVVFGSHVAALAVFLLAWGTSSDVLRIAGFVIFTVAILCSSALYRAERDLYAATELVRHTYRNIGSLHTLAITELAADLGVDLTGSVQ